jgi:hypothetical protein
MWKANKFVNLLLWALALISLGLCVWAFIGCETTTDQEEMMTIINPMLVWSYTLVGIAAVLTVFLPLPQVIENPKSAIGIVVGILAFGVVILISYLFASTDLHPSLILPGQVTPNEGTIKFADVNIISVYIMLFATILVTIGASIANVLKMR